MSRDPLTTETPQAETVKATEVAGRALLADPPRLHHWGGEPVVGG